MFTCFTEGNNGEVHGELWAPHFGHKQPFQELASLLLVLDRLLDELLDGTVTYRTTRGMKFRGDDVKLCEEH